MSGIDYNKKAVKIQSNGNGNAARMTLRNHYGFRPGDEIRQLSLKDGSLLVMHEKTYQAMLRDKKSKTRKKEMAND